MAVDDGVASLMGRGVRDRVRAVSDAFECECIYNEDGENLRGSLIHGLF